MDDSEMRELVQPLTPEEFAAMEKDVLATTRALHQEVQRIIAQIPPGKEPELVAQLERSAANMLLHVETAAALDGGPGEMKEA